MHLSDIYHYLLHVFIFGQILLRWIQDGLKKVEDSFLIPLRN